MSREKVYNTKDGSVFYEGVELKGCSTGEMITFSSKLNNEPKQEKQKMTMQRRTVTVELIDPDQGLPVENSLVLRAKNVMTEDNDEVTIREVLMKVDVAAQLAKHNEKRSTIINEEILNRTGNEVFLRPVKLKDLRWVVK